MFDFGIGAVVGPINMNWKSSESFKTNFDLVTDLEFGGGAFVCFDHPFPECKPETLPFDINIGTGKYTGMSFNSDKICFNIGASKGLLPIDLSFPKWSFDHLKNSWD